MRTPSRAVLAGWRSDMSGGGGGGGVVESPLSCRPGTPLVQRRRRQLRRSQLGLQMRIVEIDPDTERTVSDTPMSVSTVAGSNRNHAGAVVRRKHSPSVASLSSSSRTRDSTVVKRARVSVISPVSSGRSSVISENMFLAGNIMSSTRMSTVAPPTADVFRRPSHVKSASKIGKKSQLRTRKSVGGRKRSSNVNNTADVAVDAVDTDCSSLSRASVKAGAARARPGRASKSSSTTLTDRPAQVTACDFATAATNSTSKQRTFVSFSSPVSGNRAVSDNDALASPRLSRRVSLAAVSKNTATNTHTSLLSVDSAQANAPGIRSPDSICSHTVAYGVKSRGSDTRQTAIRGRQSRDVTSHAASLSRGSNGSARRQSAIRGGRSRDSLMLQTAVRGGRSRGSVTSPSAVNTGGSRGTVTSQTSTRGRRSRGSVTSPHVRGSRRSRDCVTSQTIARSRRSRDCVTSSPVASNRKLRSKKLVCEARTSTRQIENEKTGDESDVSAQLSVDDSDDPEYRAELSASRLAGTRTTCKNIRSTAKLSKTQSKEMEAEFHVSVKVGGRSRRICLYNSRDVNETIEDLIDSVRQNATTGYVELDQFEKMFRLLEVKYSGNMSVRMKTVADFAKCRQLVRVKLQQVKEELSSLHVAAQNRASYQAVLDKLIAFVRQASKL